MILGMFKKSRVYLDFAAATPLSKSAFLAMRPFLTETFGNPSAVHQEGVAARRAVEAARHDVAEALSVRPEFVTFTSGGTESNNLSIIGVVAALHEQGRAYADMEVVTTRIEHPSIMATMQLLERQGVVVRYVAVDSVGQISLAELGTPLNEKTILVSCAYANSEIGVIQPVRTIKRAIEAAEKKFGTTILFHVDAAQAPLWLSCQFSTVQADLLALDVGKCHGPKGVGVLVRSRRAHIAPVLFGGGQETGLRPGTENTAGVVGASVALKEAQQHWKARLEKVSAVRDEGISILLQAIPHAVLNGPTGEKRLANNINISVPGLDTEYATIVLDKHGFAVSTKSACAGAGGGESAVVKAISNDPARSRSTLRISLGPDTNTKNLKDLTKVLKAHIEKMSKY